MSQKKIVKCATLIATAVVALSASASEKKEFSNNPQGLGAAQTQRSVGLGIEGTGKTGIEGTGKGLGIEGTGKTGIEGTGKGLGIEGTGRFGLPK